MEPDGTLFRVRLVTEQQLISLFSQVRWLEPITVTVGGKSSLACRLCIAMRGISGKQIARGEEVMQTKEEFEKHMRDKHPVCFS